MPALRPKPIGAAVCVAPDRSSASITRRRCRSGCPVEERDRAWRFRCRCHFDGVPLGEGWPEEEAGHQADAGTHRFFP